MYKTKSAQIFYSIHNRIIDKFKYAVIANERFKTHNHHMEDFYA